MMEFAVGSRFLCGPPHTNERQKIGDEFLCFLTVCVRPQADSTPVKIPIRLRDSQPTFGATIAKIKN